MLKYSHFKNTGVNKFASLPSGNGRIKKRTL